MTADAIGPEIVTVCLADVKPEKVNWLWPGRIPAGKVALLEGDPGLGKSTVMLDLAARISVGGTTPDGHSLPLGNTVVLTAEDGLSDTVRPRIDAAGGDPGRVYAVDCVVHAGVELPFTLPAHALGLRSAILQHAASLVVIDPLVAHLGGDTNSHRDADIRRALRPLTTIAEDTNAAIVIIRHLTKTPGGPALYRGGGSIGIIAAVRAAMVIARDPDDSASDSTRRVLAVVKSNLCASAPSLAFHVEGDDQERVVIRWDGQSAHGADALVVAVSDPEERTAGEEVQHYLRGALADGRQPAADLMLTARRDYGVSDRTIRRARLAAGVLVTREGFGPGSRVMWSLPEQHSGHDPNTQPSMAPVSEAEPRSPKNTGLSHSGNSGHADSGHSAVATMDGALIAGLRDLVRGRPDLSRQEILRRYPGRSRAQVEVALDALDAEAA